MSFFGFDDPFFTFFRQHSWFSPRYHQHNNTMPENLDRSDDDGLFPPRDIPSARSASPAISEAAAHTRPTMPGDFPTSQPSSQRSSISSLASILPEGHHHLGTAPMPPHRTVSSSTISSSASVSGSRTPVDALSKQFPKPTTEPTIDEMLARKPLPWTLGHYVKHARDTRTPVRDKEQMAKEFQNTKAELLKAKEEMKKLSFGSR